jgi:hypothetical protein
MLGWDIYGISERLNVAKAQAEFFNVLRRGDHDGRFKEWDDLYARSRVGLVRSKVSLWVRSTGSLVYPLLLGPSRDTHELLGSIPIVP